MRSRLNSAIALTGIALALGIQRQTVATAHVITAPAPILDVVTSGLPKTPTANVRVVVATLAPGDSTFWHTHPTPPFIYVQSGTGIWEYRGGRESQTRHAGQAIMEPADVATRIVNRGTVPLTIIVFQASRPGELRIQPAK